MIRHHPMPSQSQHCIHRCPSTPWAELRVSANTRDCYRAHTHGEYSVGIVDQGSATFHHPSGPHNVKAGSVVLIEPDVVHSCNPVSGHIWSYRMLFIEATWLHNAVTQALGLVTPPDGLEFMSRCIEAPSIALLVDQLCQPFDSASAARALTMELPTWLAGLARAGKPVDCTHVPSELVPAVVTMQTECENHITVRGLADTCGDEQLPIHPAFSGGIRHDTRSLPAKLAYKWRETAAVTRRSTGGRGTHNGFCRPSSYATCFQSAPRHDTR
jgi:hypothetical protein